MSYFRTAALLLLASLPACSSPPQDVAESSAQAVETRPGDPLPSFASTDLVWLEGHATWSGKCIGTKGDLMNGTFTVAGVGPCSQLDQLDQSYTVERLPNGYYQFHNADNGRCLDAGDGGNGTVVVEWACGRESAQWRSVQLTADAYRLVNVPSSRCLDLDLRDGHTLQVWDCHDGENQRWRLHRATTFYLQVLDTNKCLDVGPSWSTADGVHLDQWDCWPQDNERLFVIPRGSNYELRAVHSGKCVAFQDAGDTNGTPLVQISCSGGAEQQVRISDAFDHFGRVTPSYIDKCLDRNGPVGNSSNGAPMALWDCWGGRNQQFRFYAERY